MKKSPKGAKPKLDDEALVVADAYVRQALEALSNKRISDATVRSMAKKVLQAVPVK
jgi:hypothetical protein